MTMPPVGPLDGVRVVDASTVLAGPLVAQVLGDFGADVIKIEHPRHHDSLRGHGAQRDGHGLWWKMVARNKRCITLDLGKPTGAEVFLELAATADVVVENFRPGTLERWGLGWEELSARNPGLILCRVTGFGQTGPYARRPAFGTLIEAMSGFAHMTGEADRPPTLPPFGLADSVAGISGVAAVMMALHHRHATGQGQVIDVSILEAMATVLGPHVVTWDQTGQIQGRAGNRSTSNAPRNTYLTADRHWVAVSSSADAVARRTLQLVGRADLVNQPWFSTGAGRADHAEEIDRAMSEWIGERTLVEVIDAFEAAEVALAPVCDAAQYVADAQVQAREAVTTVDDPDLGPMRMQNLLFGLSATPGAIRHTGRSPGADTDEVLAELGLDIDQVAALRREGAVA
ncbi:CaiB/BaiF CoA transferase family protein [Candidatus Poriferisocius sp.]|uniref:CaiB/BaiF CoA transferase family protein n=1 Tax=Candidatus Poriferisocius sp. TaxID=3101276 RepID=UPI003B5CB17E